MRRVTVAAIMQATGLSRATVDRVLNGRGHVHPRTRIAVETAIQHLSAGETPPPRPQLACDMLLRVGRGMMAQMRTAWDNLGAQGEFLDMYQAREDQVEGALTRLCADPARPLIVGIKSTDRLCAVLAAARARGKRVVTIVTDLGLDARDTFVGIDNRAAGQTAAHIIGRSLGYRPTTVGVVLGDFAFRCHEDREIGFRTGLRAHFPKMVIQGEAQGQDDADQTRAAVSRMLKDHPAIGAIYNVGGGNLGLVDAIKTAGRTGDILVVGHEVNAVTTPLMRAGTLDFAIASDPQAQLAEALRLATTAEIGRSPRLLDFGVYSRFNLPAFARNAA